MAKTLSRDLGIFSLISIACGAMVSGLLVLPGYAAAMTGPSVFFAFLLAGVLFLPATFSKSEMATALPQAGGDYLFIDRSLGPLFSTISGLGMFFTLVMKSAFALAGFGAYLVIAIPFPDAFADAAGVLIAGLIILVNYRGAKKSGTVQQVLFIITVLALVWFIGEGSLGIRAENLHPAMTGGWVGFFSATAFVFVSYAGVTKIASVAEEVKNPGRMIPIGMLVSLGTMVFLYVVVVYFMVGNVPVSRFLELEQFKDAPLALAGLEVAGPWGMYFLAVISALALIAMANAGVLASSRYPFALSRYQQLPDLLNRVHPTFSTPSVSILLTGMLLILSITFLPVVQLAKLASAFKLIVLAMLNCALIILRESDIEWYQPDFRSPFYPYIQLFGIAASLFLIGFLGWTTILSSAGLILGGVTWYYGYVIHRVDRVGAIFQSAAVDAEDLELFERARSPRQSSMQSVIVPFFDLNDVDPVQIERRLRLAASLCAENERLDVVDFVEIAEQSLLSEYESDESKLELLQERVQLLSSELDNEIHVDQVITHDARGAITNYALEERPHWVVFDWKEPSPWQILIGIRKWWLEDFPCDTLFFQDNGRPNFDDIYVVSEPGPYDGELLYAVNNIASFFDSNVTFINPVDPENSESVEFIESYHDELKAMMDRDASSETVPRAKWEETMIDRSETADFILTGGEMKLSFFGNDDLIDRGMSRQFECNFARVRSNFKSPRSVLPSKKEKAVDVRQFLERDGSIVRLDPEDKQTLFRNISESFDGDDDLIDTIEDSLWNREEIQNTYIDNGVAFPHAILEALDETRLRIVVLEHPVSYTPEGDDVSLCMVTLGPPGDRETHLEVLRELSGILVDETIVERLHEVSDYSEALELFTKHFD